MRVNNLMEMCASADEIYTIIVVYDNGIEEEYEDWFIDEETRNYIYDLKFESFDLYEQDGNKILQIWL